MPVIDKPLNHHPRISIWVLVALFLAYALPGNLGHVPWRGDDILHVGIANEMLRTGDWLVPRIGGFAYLEWPPLTHWIGAITGSLFSWLLTPGDAIRLGSVLCSGLTIWLLRATAIKLYSPEAGNAAFFAALGSLGLIIHTHEAQPQITLLAAMAGVFYGLALTREAPGRGALITGLAGAAAFLAAGLPGALLTMPLWLVLPLTCRECRHGKLGRAFLLALSLGLSLVVIWPILLAWQQPVLFDLWWHLELDAFLPHQGHLNRAGALAQMILWFSWPLLPIVLWSIWRRRRTLGQYQHVLPVSSLLIALWLVITTGAFRPANALPLLPALILLTGAEIPHLRRGAANFLDWFGVMTFCALSLFLWLAWLALHFGWPAPLARNVMRLTPGFDANWSAWTIVLALALTAAWIISIVRMPFFQLRGIIHWALGVTLSWGLATTLWLDWFDYDKNYQPVMRSIASLVHKNQSNCLAGLDVGESQRAALSYFENIKLDPRASALKRCTLVLSYASGRNAMPKPTGNWERIWQRSRTRGRQAESFALYRKLP